MSDATSGRPDLQWPSSKEAAITQDTGPIQPAPSDNPPSEVTPAYGVGAAWPGASGSWGQPVPAGRSGNSVNAISIVEIVAGVAILVSLLLPWIDVAAGYFDFGTTSTFVSLATDSVGLARSGLDFVLLGVAIAIVASVASLSTRVAGRLVSPLALVGFGLVAFGTVNYLAEGEAWDYSILSPGPGVYFCLLAAVVGALAAVGHLANPRLGTSSAAPVGYWGGDPYSAAPQQWSAWPGSPYPGPYAHPAPYQPAQTWPPQPLQPTQAAVYPSSIGSAAQLVVLEGAQSRVLSVQPGAQLLVGSDANAQIRLVDPAVQPWHTSIERRGNAWVVRDLQTASPSRLMDATGSIYPVIGETTIETGQLLIGSVLLTLYQG